MSELCEHTFKLGYHAGIPVAQCFKCPVVRDVKVLVEALESERDRLLEWEAECKAAGPSSGADLSPDDWMRQIRVYLHWHYRPGIQQEHRYFELRRIVESAISETTAERDELQRIFDLQRKRDYGWIKQWRLEHPGNDLVQPDYGTMLDYLMAKLIESTEGVKLVEADRDRLLDAGQRLYSFLGGICLLLGYDPKKGARPEASKNLPDISDVPALFQKEHQP